MFQEVQENMHGRGVCPHSLTSVTHLNAGKTSNKVKVLRGKSKLSLKDIIYQERCFLTPSHHLDMTHFKRLSGFISLTVHLQELSRITTR